VKNRSKVICLFAALLVGGHALAAAADIAGVWRGKLQVDPKTAITIQFTFAKKPDGSYSAVLDSPGNAGIKNVSATTVSLTDSALKVTVNALSGSYSGTVKGGSIEGQWTQPGGALPLVLSPYQKAELSRTELDAIVGAWSGPVRFSGNTLTFVFRFDVDDKSELHGTLSVPEQAGIELAMSELEFGNGQLTFKVPQVQGEFSASHAKGELVGTWKQGGNPRLPVTLKKGGAIAPKAIALKLSSESFAALSGVWRGTLKVKNPQGEDVSLPLVMVFATDEHAEMIGFFDSPSQKATNIPITAVSLAAGKFAAKVAGLGAEYRGTLSGSTLTGEWSQGPQSWPLTFKR
jgi:hypothetical protein